MSAPKIPYPPSPDNVPEGLTDYPDSYTKQQNLLLAGLFVFLIFYIGMVILFAMVGTWCALTMAKYPAAKIIGLVFSATFFLFLVKGFFKRPAVDKEMHIEITEEEHPVLFGFIHQVCDELGAPEPNRVYVSPDVNAAVMPRTSLVNLFVEPKKDLLIGLGLVNCVNLSEFKAVLAHEFGHFSQSAMASSYTYVASRIIGDLVDGEDWFDRLVNWCKRQEGVFGAFGYAVGACLWLGRKILEWLYKAITLQRLAVSREREFHADLVAVSAAGSNAVVHCLLRTEFGHQCFMQALDELYTALDHKLYSNDLYLHQDRAATIVRRKKKEPELGLPPALNAPTDGKSVTVFDPEEEELTDDIPPMWRTHPSNSDREANAKEQFVPAVVDHRSPWILFSDPAELRERISYKFYRMVWRIPKNSELTAARKVQEYIDNEHAETTYDPKYHGAYDDRPLEPGDVTELNGIIHDSPWNDDRMEKVYAKLYEGCREHAEAHADLHKELASLNANVVGKPSPKMKKRIEEVEKKLDENWEWFKSFDRRVYLLHVQMAAQVNGEWRNELVERYRFQVEVQRFYQEARKNFNKADWYIGAYSAWTRGEFQAPQDFGAEVISVLRAAWKALKTIIQDAREVNLPAMKNFEEGERLADFILEGKMVPEPPLTELKGAWVQKLMNQLLGVKNRCFRLHFKSVGGILALQEKVAAAWLAAREPVPAEVVEVVEPIPAEVVAEAIPAEVIPAEVVAEAIPVEVIPAEVVPVEPLDAIPAEIVPAMPAEPPPMAAFKATPPAPPAPPPWPPPTTPAPTVPAEAVAPPPVSAAAAADGNNLVFNFDADAKPAESPVPAPEPVAAAPAAEPEPVFSFDADTAPTVLAPKPAELSDPVADPAAEAPDIFSLDAAEPAAPAEEVFTLDADEIAAATPPVAKPVPVGAKPAPPPGAEEIFSLDAEEPIPAIPVEDVIPAEEVIPIDEVAEAVPVKPATPPAPKSGFGTTPTAKPASGVGAAPVARPAGSGVMTVPAPKSGAAPAPTPAANGTHKPVPVKRPAVKITLVKPGDKSPFAK